MNWDPQAVRHLRHLSAQIERSGLTGHVHGVVQELWRANVERQDPDALYDDASTLGYTSFRNVSNRLHSELRGTNGALYPGATAVRENQSTVFRVREIEIRLVKARVDRGRKPRFTVDFRWDAREGRLMPANRNFECYVAPLLREDHEPLFEIPVSNAAERIAACRDVFMVWAGDSNGRTAGWYGLPTAGSGAWLAVQPAWFDEDGQVGGIPKRPDGPLGGPGFSDLEAPEPQITLKPQRADGSING